VYSALLAVGLCACMFAAAPALAQSPEASGAAVARSAPMPTRAKVLEVQHLFRRLGYPLGGKALGGLGPRTKGALSYFQRKYGLPVTGRPDARTLRLMRTVAASLNGGAAGAGSASAAAKAQPSDLVEELLGEHLPLLGVAVGLAALLALLALSARERPA
jgi:peptidoglycan hydrolase-like protein with peptidoglycan-binding domain